MRRTPLGLAATAALFSASLASAAPGPTPPAKGQGAAPVGEASAATAAPPETAPSSPVEPATVRETAPPSFSPSDAVAPADASAETPPPAPPVGPSADGADARPATTSLVVASAPAPAEAAPPGPAGAARDTVGGHLAVGARAGLAMPFGGLGDGEAQSSRLRSGALFGGDLTLGVSRTVVLGAYGELAMLSGEGAWSGRDVSSIAAGALLRYHLVQGVRFDPRVSGGIGFRRTTAGSDALTGMDFVRVQVGGDYYATSQLGFGPFLDLSLGTYLDSSSGAISAKEMNAHFVLGGRIVFDGPGK